MQTETQASEAITPTDAAHVQPKQVLPPVSGKREIAALLGVTTRTVLNMAATGKFGNAAFKAGSSTQGGVWRFNSSKIIDMYNLGNIAEIGMLGVPHEQA